MYRWGVVGGCERAGREYVSVGGIVGSIFGVMLGVLFMFAGDCLAA